MQDKLPESLNDSLDRVDMQPINLSLLGLVGGPSSYKVADNSSTASLPALSLENASNILPQVWVPKLVGNAAAAGAAAGAAEGAKAGSDAVKRVPSEALPDVTVTSPEDKRDRCVESEEVKATLGKFDDRVPGMIVRMPEDYDPCKPVNVMVYNHGFGSSARSAIKESDLNEQMKNAPPNTILVIPEWQSSPASRSGDQGSFRDKGHFDKKMDEVFAKIPALQGRKVDDIANINIVSHSAGYGPTETEIYRNKLADKVKSITLLDSLYDPTGFDKWLKDNIHDLADGKKQFTNIYHGTSDASVAQAKRVQKMLKDEGLSQDNFYLETDKGKRVVKGDELSKHSMVFKYSSATVKDKDPHSSLPSLYVAEVNESNARNI